jgi:hypothetical protein
MKERPISGAFERNGGASENKKMRIKELPMMMCL